MEILAQVNWEDVGVMLGGLVLVLGSGKGLNHLAARRGRNGQAKVCPLHDGLAGDMKEIRADMKKLMYHLLGEKDKD